MWLAVNRPLCSHIIILLELATTTILIEYAFPFKRIILKVCSTWWRTATTEYNPSTSERLHTLQWSARTAGTAIPAAATLSLKGLSELQLTLRMLGCCTLPQGPSLAWMYSYYILCKPAHKSFLNALMSYFLVQVVFSFI